MMWTLRVQRQGMDPTAESSLHALRDLMQLPVSAVEHGELWQFDLENAGDAAGVRDALEKAASRAGRYVNLNRDAMIWDAAASTQTAPTSGCAVDVWVRQGNGEDARAVQWFQQYSGLTCRAVQRGRWYRIHVETDDAEQARRIVEDLATSRSRTHGLLANPHAENVDILRVHAHAGGVGHGV